VAFNLYEHVWNCGAVDGLEKLVLLRLADHAKPDGSSVRPSVSRVAAHCGVSVRTARQQIGALQAKAILILVREENAAKMAPREYKIDVEKLTALRSPQLGKQDAKLNARGKKNPRPQTTKKTLYSGVTPGTVCLGSEDTPRQDMPGPPGTVCLAPPAGYAGAPGTVCRENLPINQPNITCQYNQSAKAATAGKIVKPDHGELFPAPKPAHASDASLPADLIEPFGEFYDKAFPFSRDRGAAREAFRWAVIIAKATPAELIEKAGHYAAERAQDRRNRATVQQYTTKPAKWLRAESWKNAPAPAPEAELSRFHGTAQAHENAVFAAITAAVTDETDCSEF
jgi:hypothetical protein